jgi:hypothetical protein
MANERPFSSSATVYGGSPPVARDHGNHPHLGIVGRQFPHALYGTPPSLRSSETLHSQSRKVSRSARPALPARTAGPHCRPALPARIAGGTALGQEHNRNFAPRRSTGAFALTPLRKRKREQYLPFLVQFPSALGRWPPINIVPLWCSLGYLWALTLRGPSLAICWF